MGENIEKECNQDNLPIDRKDIISLDVSKESGADFKEIKEEQLSVSICIKKNCLLISACILIMITLVVIIVVFSRLMELVQIHLLVVVINFLSPKSFNELPLIPNSINEFDSNNQPTGFNVLFFDWNN
ncbi:hypothetical protein ACTA71_011063 [Dictyostelium dimigraforme]